MNTTQKIKLELDIKSVTDLPNSGTLPKQMFDLMLTEDLDIHALRFLLVFILNLKGMQIHQNEQLMLDFDKEWNSPNLEESHVALIKANFRHFLPKNYNNYTDLKKAIIYLSNVKREFEDENTYIQANLMSNIRLKKNKGFSFIMDKYWLKYLIDISHYINYDMDTIFNLNSLKSLIMYLFINSFPYIKNSQVKSMGFEINSSKSTHRGGRVNLDTVLNMLNIPLTTMPSRIKANHLDLIRQNLNKKANVSFDYKLENGNFCFITYLPTYETIDNKTDIINKYTRFIDNRIKAYALNDIQGVLLANKVLNYKLEFLNDTTARKAVLKNTSGEIYLRFFCELIDTKVSNIIKKDFVQSELSREEKQKILSKYHKKDL